MVEWSEKHPVVVAAVVVAVAFGAGFGGWSMLVASGEGEDDSAAPSFEDDWNDEEAEAAEATPQPPVADDEQSGSEEGEDDQPEARSREDSPPPPDEESSPQPERRVAEESERRQVDERRQRDAEIERPIDATPEELFPGQARPQNQKQKRGEREEYKPAVLEIVTNFDKADVTVNGLPYPEYVSGDGDQQGMVLPAGGPYHVEVTYDGKTKTYTVSLRPYEVRVMMVELSGYEGGAPGPKSKSEESEKDQRSKSESNGEEGNGRVTVYSKPKGTVHVDGEPRKQKTPGTIEVEAGQHDIQVEFEGGDMSESKTVRVRKGSRIKLFFRKRD